jgi:hypothetical protein
MSSAAFDDAAALAAALSRALAPLRCHGHVVAVPGCAAPTFREARRFVEVALWMLWRAPHVMLVPCTRRGVPVVLAATWHPRGVAVRETVTALADFEAQVAAAARTLAERYHADDRALIERLCRAEPAAPELENMEYWPEILAGITATPADAAAPDDRGTPVAGPVAEAGWRARLDDHRERLRALDD